MKNLKIVKKDIYEGDRFSHSRFFIIKKKKHLFGLLKFESYLKKTDTFNGITVNHVISFPCEESAKQYIQDY